jgi:hypothetical protein
MKEGDDGFETAVELFENLAASPDYYEVIDASLRVQVREFGDPIDTEPDERRFDLSDAYVDALDGSGAGLLEVTDRCGYLHVEADHRGAEHGIDAWVAGSENSAPEAVVVGMEVETDV